VLRDRAGRWLASWGWSVARMGRGEFWLLPAIHVVRTYHYRKVTAFFWKRALQYEHRW
jgi:hypothetical protein